MRLRDDEIIDLFHERSEQAIIELADKYGSVCRKVSRNILNNDLDAEECVNDSFLAAWNTIPPQTPNPLLSYVCRIVRNLSVRKYHANTAQKRNSHYDIALDELADCLASKSSVETARSERELTRLLNRFLDTLGKDNRVMFVRRYWYADSISDIATRFHMSSNRAAVRLFRTREKLKAYLRKEGYQNEP